MKRRYYYDLHMHSCLSPCAEDDMTPGNLAGMASLAGLELIALTDHNSCRNCPAFLRSTERMGLVGVPGMELTTAEDIHLVCLFERPEDARAFQEAVECMRIRFPNRADIFGQQLIMDEEDATIGIESDLLPNATRLSLEEGATLVRAHGGVCYPAHIDREANGILSILGIFPDTPGFAFAELRDPEQADRLWAEQPALAGVRMLFGSDAHRLDAIPDACHTLELEIEGDRPDQVRSALFRYLRGSADGGST